MSACKRKTPSWKVYWEGSFFGKGKKWSHAGRELPIGKTVSWGGIPVTIPALYLCASGLLVDFCIEASPAPLKAFLDKWAPLEERGLSREEQELAALENPLEFPFQSQISINGRVLSEEHGCGISWVPPELLPEKLPPNQEAQLVLAHYGLTPAKGWAIWRKAYPWATKRIPKISKALLTLREEPKPVPGEHFQVRAAGDSIAFTHPLTKASHRLTVQEYERQNVDFSSLFPSDGWERPSHFIGLTCLVEPPLPQDSFSISDCAPGDPSRKKPERPFEPQAQGAAAIGIIGGADGPTVVHLSASKSSSSIHAAASSLYFSPPEQVEWRMAFREKQREDISFWLEL